MEQKWFCEMCNANGSVPVETGEDVWSVVNKIRDAHVISSPTCKNPVTKIRVVNPSCVS